MNSKKIYFILIVFTVLIGLNSNDAFAIGNIATNQKPARKVVVTSVPSYNVNVASQTYTQEMQQPIVNSTVTTNAMANDIGPKTFGEEVKEGFIAMGRYSWIGIKKTGYFIGKGCYKAGHYTKIGTISFLETIGLKSNPDEIRAHEDIVGVANKTLIESRTRREFGESQLTKE